MDSSLLKGAQTVRGRKDKLSGFQSKLFYNGLLGVGLYSSSFSFIDSETVGKSLKLSEP